VLHVIAVPSNIYSTSNLIGLIGENVYSRIQDGVPLKNENVTHPTSQGMSVVGVYFQSLLDLCWTTPLIIIFF
jgi:hypothetical protein